MNTNQKIAFWSTIMKDHCTFLLLTLSSKEIGYINTAKQYKEIFNSITVSANDDSSNISANEVMSVLNQFIGFKQLILKQLLASDIELNLLPTFINHMINEAMEFYQTLIEIQTGVKNVPVKENILLHTIWLPDAAGHAEAIISNLDSTEEDDIKIANNFKKTFNNLSIKANELEKMIDRTSATNNALTYLNLQVVEKMNEFILFLKKFKALCEQGGLLGILQPVLLDHMIREEEYYLSKVIKYK